MNRKETLQRIERFLNDRYVYIDDKKYLPIENMTAKLLFIDLFKTDEEYYDYDDFRSRA